MYMLVSNTSTLVLLAKAGLLETFLEMAGTLAIPSQVKSEYAFDPASYQARLLERTIGEGKIVVKGVAEEKMTETLRHFRLHKGEAAAYALYKEGKYDAILTDDGELIKLCKLERIPFVCALAVLVRLYEKKKITKQEAQEKLQQLYTIGRYAKDIYEYYKKEVE